jgi:hypothetical protein
VKVRHLKICTTVTEKSLAQAKKEKNKHKKIILAAGVASAASLAAAAASLAAAWHQRRQHCSRMRSGISRRWWQLTNRPTD